MISGGFFDFSEKEQRLEEIGIYLAEPDIWNNPKKSASILKEKKQLESSLSVKKQIADGIEEIETYSNHLGISSRYVMKRIPTGANPKGLVLSPDKDDPCLYRSQDNGLTWEREVIEIKPNIMNHGTGDVPINIASMETGITLKYGEHKGRLLIAGRVQPPFGTNEQEYWMYNYNTAMFSDDRGKTWQVSNGIMSGTGEAALMELSDGRIYYNSRSHMSIDHRRRIAWSHDGGERFVDWYVSDDLFEIGEPFYFKYGTRPSYGCRAGLADQSILNWTHSIRLLK